MRVCIDVQSAIAQRAGVGQYTRRLVEHLPSMAEHDAVRLFYFDFKRQGVPFLAPGAAQRAVRWCPGRLVQGLWKALDWPPFDWLAGAADIYHFPNFILPPLRKGRSVVTIHDMSFVRFPDFAETRNARYLGSRIRDTVARADAIITDSQFSAEEIVLLTAADPSRVFPIHLGIGPEFRAPSPDRIASVRAQLGLDRPYILTVGTLEPRKNIPFLVDVFDRLAEFDGCLAIAGMPGWKFEPILDKLRRCHRAADIRYLDYVADEHRPALYAGAELFALTSFYEGFGFTPLEAMACGTPVISSTGGSLAEVLGDAAVLIPEFDVELWVEKVQALLADSAARAQLAAAGQQHVTRYSWGETARRTWDVYRSLA